MRQKGAREGDSGKVVDGGGGVDKMGAYDLLRRHSKAPKRVCKMRSVRFYWK